MSDTAKRIPGDQPEPSSDSGTVSINTVTNSGGINNFGGQIDTAIINDYRTLADEKYQVAASLNPYLGLASYTYADRDRFAGRDPRLALSKLTRPHSTLLFVTGASGSGKSSFVHACLLPELEKHYNLEGKQLRYTVCRPLEQPVVSLLAALPRLASHIRPKSISEVVTALSNTSAEQVNVVIIDQFEEVFSLSSAQQRQELFEFLLNLPPFEVIKTHFILTLRADYLSELLVKPRLYDLAVGGVTLHAMTEAELKVAILKPLYSAYPTGDKQFEPGLVDKLAEDAGKDAALLPLLQVTLQDLWNGGELRFSRYESYEGLAGALQKRADDVYNFDTDLNNSRATGMYYPGPTKRDPQQQNAILDLLLGLVKPASDYNRYPDVRIRRSIADLAGGQPERVKLIEELILARLLASSEENRQGNRVEVLDIIHDSLLERWEKLKNAVNARRNDLEQRDRFDQATRDWQAAGQSDDYLLSGVRLAEAEQVAEKGYVSPTNASAQTLLRRSREVQEAAQHAQLRLKQRQFNIILVTAAGLVGLLLATIVAAAFAFDGQQTAQRQTGLANEQKAQAVTAQANTEIEKNNALAARNTAETNRITAITAQAVASQQQKASQAQALTANSQIQFETDQERGVLLAMEAVKVARQSGDTFAYKQATNTLRQNLEQSQLIIATLKGHNNYVWNSNFSTDGKSVVTASWDNTAKIWETPSGKELATLKGHTSQVNSAKFSPDSKYIVTASQDNTAKIWEAVSAKEVATLKGHNKGVNSASFSFDNKYILTTSDDKAAKVWQVVSGKEFATLKYHIESVNSASFSFDNRYVVTVGLDETAKVWETFSGKEIATLKGHTDYVKSASFSPDGNYVVTVSGDKTAKIWETLSGKEIATFKGHTSYVNSASFSPGGKYVVTTSNDKTAKVWQASNGKEVASLKGHIGDLHTANFSPDGKYIVTTSSDETAKVWEALSSKEIVTLKGHTGDVTSANFSPDGKYIVTTSLDSTAKVWEALSGKQGNTLNVHFGYEDRASFSLDGKYIVTFNFDSIAKVWETASGKEMVTFYGHTREVNSARFSPDGKYVVTASRDDTAKVWEALSGKELTTLKGHTDYVITASFSSNGRYVVTASRDKTAKVWEVASGKEIVTLMGHRDYVTNANFSLDGRYVVTASWDNTARVWEVASGKEVVNFRGHNGKVYSASFSPDGKYALTASADYTAKVWEAASGREIVALKGHTGEVYEASFSPDGKFIITISGDKTARVWEATFGKEIATLNDHDKYITSSNFSSNSRYILTANTDGTAQIHTFDADTLLEEAARRVKRQLTPEERQQFGLDLLPNGTVTPGATPTPTSTPTPVSTPKP